MQIATKTTLGYTATGGCRCQCDYSKVVCIIYFFQLSHAIKIFTDNLLGKILVLCIQPLQHHDSILQHRHSPKCCHGKSELGPSAVVLDLHCKVGLRQNDYVQSRYHSQTLTTTNSNIVQMHAMRMALYFCFFMLTFQEIIFTFCAANTVDVNRTPPSCILQHNLWL